VEVLKTSDDAKKLKDTVGKVWSLADSKSDAIKVFDEEGLVKSLLRVVKKEGLGFKEAREEALGAIRHIAYYGDAVVKKGLYKFPVLTVSCKCVGEGGR